MSTPKEQGREEIGARIALALGERRIAHARFARENSVSHSFVSAVCRGEKYPSVTILQALSLLGVPLHWVLLGDGARPPTLAASCPHWADDLRPDHLKLYVLLDRIVEARGPDFAEGWLGGLVAALPAAPRRRQA